LKILPTIAGPLSSKERAH